MTFSFYPIFQASKQKQNQTENEQMKKNPESKTKLKSRWELDPTKLAQKNELSREVKGIDLPFCEMKKRRVN